MTGNIVKSLLLHRSKSKPNSYYTQDITTNNFPDTKFSPPLHLLLSHRKKRTTATLSAAGHKKNKTKNNKKKKPKWSVCFDGYKSYYSELFFFFFAGCEKDHWFERCPFVIEPMPKGKAKVAIHHGEITERESGRVRENESIQRKNKIKYCLGYVCVHSFAFYRQENLHM